MSLVIADQITREGARSDRDSFRTRVLSPVQVLLPLSCPAGLAKIR